MKHPAYIVKMSDNFLYYFVLTSQEGSELLTSEYHLNKAGCYTDVYLCQKNSPHDKSYIRATSTLGEYYFTINVKNQKIGTSIHYRTFRDRENGISNLKTISPVASFMTTLRDLIFK